MLISNSSLWQMQRFNISQDNSLLSTWSVILKRKRCFKNAMENWILIGVMYTNNFQSWAKWHMEKQLENKAENRFQLIFILSFMTPALWTHSHPDLRETTQTQLQYLDNVSWTGLWANTNDGNRTSKQERIPLFEMVKACMVHCLCTESILREIHGKHTVTNTKHDTGSH